MAPSDNTQPSPSTSTQLVALVNQAREGNRSAFTQLADKFHGDIFRTVYYRIRSQVDAEDITQDVFLKAFQKVSSVKDATKFRGWLYSITMNRIRDFQRKKRFRSLFKKEDHNIESEPVEAAGSEQPEALEQVFTLVDNALPPFYLEISGEKNAAYDDEFFQFLIPTTEDNTLTSDRGKKGTSLC